MELTQQMLAALDSPAELERLYRQDPRGFERVFPELFSQNPTSLILQTWQARLSYASTETAAPGTTVQTPFWRVLVIALVAGTLLILPYLFPGLLADGYALRNSPLLVLLALGAYFLTRQPVNPRFAGLLALVAAGAAVYINLLPDLVGSDSLLLAELHLPFFIWSLFGLAYAGNHWRETAARARFLRYNGELVIYSTLLVIGSGVLIGLGVALFALLSSGDADAVIEFFMKSLFWYGLVGIPLLATWLIERTPTGRIPFAALLARVFSPLFLLLVLAYIIAMLVARKSPFIDRNALMIFNLLLVVVLAITIFSILERRQETQGFYPDAVNLALAAVTLALDAIALSAILFRLTSYGLTPNRVAVLGANLLFFVHLLGICLHYFRLATRRGTLERLEAWIVGYLPAYAAWVLFVTLAFPLIFQYR